MITRPHLPVRPHSNCLHGRNWKLIFIIVKKTSDKVHRIPHQTSADNAVRVLFLSRFCPYFQENPVRWLSVRIFTFSFLSADSVRILERSCPLSACPAGLSLSLSADVCSNQFLPYILEIELRLRSFWLGTVKNKKKNMFPVWFGCNWKRNQTRFTASRG